MDQLRRSTLVALLVWASACATQKGGEAHLTPASAGGQVHQIALGRDASPPPPVVAAVPAPTGVVLEVGAGFGDLRIINHGPATALRSAVVVEMQREKGWVPLPISNLFLRASCQRTDAPDCVDLAHGASLEMVPWTGRLCLSQCMTHCRLDGAEEPGAYRFVVSSCEGTQTFVSSAFEGTGRPLIAQ
jgi:hypothetical protein